MISLNDQARTCQYCNNSFDVPDLIWYEEKGWVCEQCADVWGAELDDKEVL